MSLEQVPGPDRIPEWGAVAAREAEVEARLRALEERGRELEVRVRDLAAKRAELEQALSGQRQLAERLHELRSLCRQVSNAHLELAPALLERPQACLDLGLTGGQRPPFRNSIRPRDLLERHWART